MYTIYADCLAAVCIAYNKSLIMRTQRILNLDDTSMPVCFQQISCDCVCSLYALENPKSRSDTSNFRSNALRLISSGTGTSRYQRSCSSRLSFRSAKPGRNALIRFSLSVRPSRTICHRVGSAYCSPIGCQRKYPPRT